MTSKMNPFIPITAILALILGIRLHSPVVIVLSAIALVGWITVEILRRIKLKPSSTMKFFAVPLVLATFGNSGLAGCYQAINGNWCSNPSDGGFCANWPLHPVPVPNATYPPYTNPENTLNPLNEELCAVGLLASVGSTSLEVYQQWDGAGVDGFRVANWFFGAMGGAATITGCLQNFSSLTQANLWTPYWCGVNIRWQVMHSAAEISYFFNNFGCDLYAGGVAYLPR